MACSKNVATLATSPSSNGINLSNMNMLGAQALGNELRINRRRN